VLATEVTARIHRLVLRLLQDDDQDIREGAAEIVVEGVGRNRRVCQAKAMDLQWEWISTHFGKDDDTIRWAERISLDEEGHSQLYAPH
jgi:hypothetical protein